MAVYSNADTVVCWGYWRDEVTWAGVKAGDQPATVTFDPVPLSGSDTPNLRDASARGWLKTRQRVARVDPTTGYFAALLVASNDPDLDAYGGRRVTFSGEAPFVVEVPWNTATVGADAAMVAALKGALPGLTVGASVKAVPLIELALTGGSGPQPPASYLTTSQTLATVATAVDVHDTDPDAHADIRALVSQGGVSDATASSKGVTRLLGGTADAPTAPWSKVTGAPTSYPPSGGAGGVLSGTFPNPGFAVDMATQAELDAAVAAVPEQARDAIGAALVAGANVGISVNDAADTITITATVPASYSDEQAQDAAAALIAAGTHSGISFAYDDAGNALTATVAFPVSSVNGRTGNVTGLAEQTALTAHTGDTTNPHAVTKSQVGLGNVSNLAPADLPVSTATSSAISSASTADRDRGNHTGNQPASSISDLPEAVQDIVGGFIVAGDNVTVTYNDAANTFRIDAVGGGGGGGGTTDQEVVRDTIGAALVAGANIQITVDDPGNTITVAVTGLATVATTGSYADLSNKPVTGVSSVNTRSGAVTGLAEATDLTAHTGSTANPHGVTKAQVGLGSVDNTSDAAKPISTATQSALDAKTPTTRQVTAGTGLSGGGDLTADRSFTVSYGTTAGTAAQGNDARLSDQRTPLDSSVTDAKVAPSAAIAESKLALASDAVAGTASRRTLGTGAQQAAAGNHNHDAAYSATGHTHTGYAATSHTHSVSDLTATGTRDATTFLRGDNTWAAIAAAGYSPVSRTFAQGAYTASANDYVLADASGGAFTVTLPASGIAGVKKVDSSANIVTVAASSGKTIGTLAAASVPLRLPDQAMVTQFNGTNHVITEGYHSLTELDARFNPSSAALDRLQARFACAVTDPARVVFAGSSTTAGTGASSAAASYVNRTAAALQAAYPSPVGSEAAVGTSLAGTLSTNGGIQPYNVGVGGTTSADYISTTVQNQIIAATPAVVIHMIGSNDFFNGVDPAVYKSNLATKLSALRSGTPNTVHVLVQSYQRIDVAGTYPWAAYGQALKELAAANPADTAFVDASGPFAAAGVPGSDPLDLIGTDNVHSTDRGHYLLADVIRFKLRAVGPPKPIVATSGGVTRTAARWTSDTGSGTSSTNIVGRTSDALYGGNGKTWVGDASVVGTNGSAIVRGSSNPAAWFAGLAEPVANTETSITMAALPVGAALLLDLHRGGSAGATASDVYRLVLGTDGSITVTKRVSGTTTTLASGYTYAVGDRVAIRYYNGSVELRVNGTLLAAITDSAVAAKGFTGMSSTSANTAITISSFVIDVIT